MRATKIVATLGPATSSHERIRALALAGANVFRLNFSHGSHADHQARFQTVREVERELGTTLAILQDLQGPKIRLGVLPGGPRETRAGERLRFTAEPAHSKTDVQLIPFPHADIIAELQIGQRLFIDDGKVRIRVLGLSPDGFEAEVDVPGRLSDRKGVNLPDTALSLSPLTRKDREDLAFGLALGVDWVALSFVQRASDLHELRELVAGRAGILAKLEKPQVFSALPEIVAAADAVMVARGDLGVEMPPEEVPGLQRRIISTARQMGKPVVVATQMLESMIQSPVPTRAEASDVAHAVYEGTDAVMLSAETASGEHPVEAVAMMAKIVTQAQQDAALQDIKRGREKTRSPSNTNDKAQVIAVALRAAHAVAQLSCTVTYTTSGASALLVARERAPMPILALTPHVETARRLCLAWGVQSVVSADAAHVEGLVELAVSSAQRMQLTDPARPLAVVAGLPFATAGTTNLLRIVWPGTVKTLHATAPDESTKRHMKSPYFEAAYLE